MNRKVLPAIALLAAGAVAVPALTQAQPAGPRDITVRERVQSINFVHQKRAKKDDRLATGDRVLTRQRLFDTSDKSIGTLYTDCVNVGRAAAVFAATLQCSATYSFADGQLTASGLFHVGTSGGPAPIVGGSGAYRGTGGDVTSGRPGKGYDVDVLHLDG